MTSYHGKPQCVLTLNHVVISRVSYQTNMALLYHHSKADNSPGPTLGIKQFPIYHPIYIRPSEWGIVRIVDYWIGYNGFAHTDIHNVTFYPACTLQLYSGLRVHTSIELHCTLAMQLAAMRQLQNIKTVSTPSHSVMWPPQGWCMKSWDRKNGQVLAT